MKIEVGMMVEIINTDYGNKHFLLRDGCPEFMGHVGEVLSKYDTHHYVICGAERDPVEGYEIWFRDEDLRPISPDEKASWNNEVWENIGWKPDKIKVLVYSNID